MRGKEEGAYNQNQSSRENLQLSKTNLMTCVDFCTNEVDCRRELLLQYFGEHFPREKCNKTCDNCRLVQFSTQLDATQPARLILEVLKVIIDGRGQYQPLTMIKLAKLCSGSKV